MAMIRVSEFLSLLGAALLLAIPLHAETPLAPDGVREKSIYKVGVIAPLSGPVASWGGDTRKALELANSTFGDGTIELVFEDGRCLGKDAATAAQKLVSVDKVQFAMVVCTEEMLASAPIFDRAKVTVVAPGATAASISGISPYVFRTWPSDAFGAARLAKYMKPRLKKVGVFSEGRGLPQEFAKAFQAAASKEGLEVVVESYFSEDQDYRSALTRLLSSGVQGVLINSDSEASFINVLRQFRQLSKEVPVFGNLVGSSKSFRDAVGSLAEGLVYYDVPIISGQGADSNLGKEFERAHGLPASSPYMVASSISALRVVREIIRNGGDPRDFLLSNSFESAIGKFSFTKEGDIAGIYPSLKMIQSGKTVALDD